MVEAATGPEADPFVRGWLAGEGREARLARDYATIAALAARGDPTEIEIRGARHDLELVVERIVVKEGVRARLTESLATAGERPSIDSTSGRASWSRCWRAKDERLST